MRKIIALAFIVKCVFILAQKPTASFTVSASSLCAGECLEVTNTSSENSLTFQWTFSGGTPSAFSGESPGPICFEKNGSYTIKLVTGNTFGFDSSKLTINVGQIPIIRSTLADTITDTLAKGPADDILIWKKVQDTSICMFDQAYMWVKGYPSGGALEVFESGLESNPISYVDYISAELNTKNNPKSSPLPDSLNKNILTVIPFYSTWYVFRYTLNGCKTKDSLYVEVPCFNDSVKVVLPNSFSPNGDGENDYFRLLTNVDSDNNFLNNEEGGFYEGGAIVEVDFRIFDRYGHLVFRTTNPHEGWDGTCNGKLVNPATYTYFLTYRRIDGRSEELKGNVTLFR
jgi:gliding motility-associated-like protein